MTDNSSYFYLYCDSGATFEFLRQALKPYEEFNIKTRKITSRDIVERKILQEDKEKILCTFFPGARSGQAYHDDLGSEGIQEVKNYVAQGGVYTGICAGAYMACKQIVYRGIYSNKDVISEWDFFKGIAYGQLPLLEPVKDKPVGWQTANITSVSYKNPGNLLPLKTDILYWGGPLLIPEEGEELNVLATYDAISDEKGNPAIAIASKSYGNGMAVFLGVHSEISGEMLSNSRSAKLIDHETGKEKGEFRMSLAERLLNHENGRHSLFQLSMNEIFKTQRGKDHLNAFICQPPTLAF